MTPESKSQVNYQVSNPYTNWLLAIVKPSNRHTIIRRHMLQWFNLKGYSLALKVSLIAFCEMF